MALIPDEYMLPDMMAIGDSLYQGVRSLTIKPNLNSEWPVGWGSGVPSP